jgi:hypothetical protein
MELGWSLVVLGSLLSSQNPHLVLSYVSKGKHDPNAEEGWTLLPNGDVLTIDTSGSVYQPDEVEVYH